MATEPKIHLMPTSNRKIVRHAKLFAFSIKRRAVYFSLFILVMSAIVIRAAARRFVDDVKKAYTAIHQTVLKNVCGLTYNLANG